MYEKKNGMIAYTWVEVDTTFDPKLHNLKAKEQLVFIHAYMPESKHEFFLCEIYYDYIFYCMV